MRSDPKLKMLRGIPLFGAYEDRRLRNIAGLLDAADVCPGTAFVTAGRSPVHGQAFLVAEGAATVTLAGHTFGHAEPGDFVGVAGTIGEGCEVETAVAETAMRVLVMDRATLVDLLAEDAVACALARQLVDRLRAVVATPVAPGRRPHFTAYE